MRNANEHSLIQQIQTGNQAAFRELVEKYKTRIYYFAYDLCGNPQDAEDLTQDVFIKTYRSIHQFRMEANFLAWIYRITLNTFIDQKRKKSFWLLKFNLDDQDAEKSIPEPVDTSHWGNPESQAEATLIQKQLDQALNQLSPKERSAFVLRHYHDQSIKEIVEIMSLSEGTVKSLIFRAIKKLQKSLSFYKNEFGTECVE